MSKALESCPCNGCRVTCTKGGSGTCVAWREWFSKCWNNIRRQAGFKEVEE